MRAGDPVTVHVFANDTGSGLHLISATDPHHGAVDCNEDGTCVYTPAAAFTGSDGFTYTAENDQSTRLTADVHLTVAPATAGYGVKVGGAPAPSAKAGITQGQGASWSAAVSPSPAGVSAEALAALPRPAVTAELDGRARDQALLGPHRAGLDGRAHHGRRPQRPRLGGRGRPARRGLRRDPEAGDRRSARAPAATGTSRSSSARRCSPSSTTAARRR